MRFGIILDGGNLPGESRAQALEDRLGKARLTREWGYHSLWMGGGFLNNGWHASSLLARAAAEASGLELGLLALLPLDHPVALAEQVSTLDAIARGRLVLGVSLGWRPHELQAFNVERTERLSRFRESLEVMKLLWTQDRVSYEGKHYRLENAPGAARPIQSPHPPIYVGANMDRGVIRAGREADGWLVSSRATVTTIQRQMPLYREAAEKANQPANVVAWREMYVAPSRDEAIDTIRPYVEAMYSHRASLGHNTELPEADRIPSSFDQVLEGRFIVGSPAECAEQVQSYADAGVDELVMRCQWPGMPGTDAFKAIELFAREVMPAFR